MAESNLILFVEDDKMLTGIYQDRLKEAGFEVVLAPNLEIGLDILKKQKPEVILLNIFATQTDIYEQVKAIKQDPATKEAAIILLTPQLGDLNQTKAIEAGADDYIVKSEALPATVVKKIEAIIKRKPGGSTAKEEPAEAKSNPEMPQIEVQPEENLTPPISQPSPANELNPAVGLSEEHHFWGMKEEKHSRIAVYLLVVIILLIITSDIFFYFHFIGRL